MVKETKLYDILGLPANANKAQIKKAYRANALKYHPDKNQHNFQATERFKEISKAYEVLCDDEKRLIYDRYGDDGLNGNYNDTANGGTDDLFSQFFGDSFFIGGSGSSANSRRKGKNIYHSLTYDLQDLYNGKSIRLGLNKQVRCEICGGKGASAENIKKCFQCDGRGIQVIERSMGMMVQRVRSTCERCRGSGEFVSPKDRCSKCNGGGYYDTRKILSIDIRPGTKDGESIVLKNEADEGPNIIPGDVIITIHQKIHHFFERKDDDLYGVVDIDLLTALCGGSVMVKYFNNKLIKIDILKGEIIKPGDVKVIKNYGMPRYYNNGKFSEGIIGYGDLFIKFNIIFPQPNELTDQNYQTLEKALPMRPSVNIAQATKNSNNINGSNTNKDGTTTDSNGGIQNCSVDEVVLSDLDSARYVDNSVFDNGNFLGKKKRRRGYFGNNVDAEDFDGDDRIRSA
ncbi:hypothetical protein PACTADRAFT_66409 [Pachysolen tannophilus NRRL Y-2460]|uniref:J domain-containing protein n=1 Tax=Pachysolen tannophilus NRRL Y-2460 TaxID=669874 RepID=A0A1E4U084_PACTA|nr:hypothetical protein PACTADRAFT_66409 [Pachysolen tannophilus NRRL Y-2460]